MKLPPKKKKKQNLKVKDKIVLQLRKLLSPTTKFDDKILFRFS